MKTLTIYTRYVRNLALTFVAALVLCSCEDFIDTAPPDSQLFGEDVFEDRATANAAMAGLYTKLRDEGILTGGPGGISLNLGLYADELDYFQSGIPNSFFSNSLFAADPGVADTWNLSYNHIYVANAIIEGVTDSRTLAQADRNQLIGESLLARALIHLHLVNIYGKIPYITTTDYHTNMHLGRSEMSEVYDRLTSDLQQSAALLPEAYVSSSRTRPNKAAALALLARAYLYAGNFTAAASASTEVIGDPQLLWEDDLNAIFMKDCTATIWQFSPSNPTAGTLQAQLFIFNEGPPPNYALSSAFMDSFEQGDLRKAHWTREVTDGTSSWFHPYKYKDNGQGETSTEFAIILRLDELYLIRAEALARLGDFAGAREDIDRIRQRAGLLPTTANAEQELLKAVLAERNHELFTEYGHRFFDLKRSGLADQLLGPVKSGWDSNDKLWPIPEQELISNPNLNPQNDGY